MYFCSLIQLSLEAALKLQIPEESDDGREMRYYSLEDLRELQNKLMLMSGKGDQGQNEVDHFAEVFSNTFGSLNYTLLRIICSIKSMPNQQEKSVFVNFETLKRANIMSKSGLI